MQREYRGHEQVAGEEGKTGENVQTKGILGGWGDTEHV